MELLLDGSWYPRIEVNISILLLSETGDWDLNSNYLVVPETRSSFHHMQYTTQSVPEKKWVGSLNNLSCDLWLLFRLIIFSIILEHKWLVCNVGQVGVRSTCLNGIFLNCGKIRKTKK